jgi:DnaK suppressor protein
VSKTPAKAAPRPAAKKAAASKAPAKAAKPVAKPAAKPSPKVAPAKAAAPAKKAAPAKVAPPKAAAQPPAKPAAKPAAQPAPAPQPAPKPAPIAAAPVKPTPVKSPAKSSSKSSSRPSVPQPQLSVPLPPPSRPAPSNVVDLPRPVRKIDPKLVNVWKTKAGRDLTEDELLSMPDAEYMNDKQLDYFRAVLEQQKDDLLSNAGETTEHLREDTSIVPDPADRATIEEEHALELRTRDRERKLLKKISQSLARIEAGDYGFCDETGEPIGLGRLLARPTATLSLEAQQRREMKQKMFGD